MSLLGAPNQSSSINTWQRQGKHMAKTRHATTWQLRGKGMANTRQHHRGHCVVWGPVASEPTHFVPCLCHVFAMSLPCLCHVVACPVFAMCLPCICNVFALSLPCVCHVFAMSLPCCCCPVAAVRLPCFALSLPCFCHVFAMSLLCLCHVFAMSLPCFCPVFAMPLLCFCHVFAMSLPVLSSLPCIRPVFTVFCGPCDRAKTHSPQCVGDEKKTHLGCRTTHNSLPLFLLLLGVLGLVLLVVNCIVLACRRST
jgi:hypothetical protein